MKRLWLVSGLLCIALVAIAYLVSNRAWTTTAPLAIESMAGPSINPATLEITYIANEGVLVSSGDKQVLIDGLHREYQPAYAFLPPAQREKIETAKVPFDQIDLILVSPLINIASRLSAGHFALASIIMAAMTYGL